MQCSSEDSSVRSQKATIEKVICKNISRCFALQYFALPFPLFINLFSSVLHLTHVYHKHNLRYSHYCFPSIFPSHLLRLPSFSCVCISDREDLKFEKYLA